MIADVLSDAAHEIRDYLRHFPEVYEDVAPQIGKLLKEMDDVRSKLDTPPEVS